MSTDISQTLEGLRERVNRAQAARARAEADHARAVQDKEKALSDLQEQFGVSSVQEAVETLKGLEAELQQEIINITTALEEAEA